MSSIGNSLPSLRRPISSSPVPICLHQRLGVAAGVVGDEPLGEAFGNDGRDLLPQEFVAHIAELPLRLDIHQHDVAAPVHHDHRIRRRLEQTAILAFHLRQMTIGGFAHGDVADRRRHQDALGAFERAEHELDRKLAAVLAPPDQFQPRADLLHQRLGVAAGVVGDEPLGEAFRNDDVDFLSQELVVDEAELPLRLDIHQHDVAVRIHHDHRIRRRLEQTAILAFHLRQPPHRTRARVANGLRQRS